MRVVVIDPYTKTVTEEKLPVANPTKGIEARDVVKQTIKHVASDVITLATPVENDNTGDRLYVNRAWPHDAPAFRFLGDEYRGRALIAGRDIAVDAAVPLARVKKQVSF